MKKLNAKLENMVKSVGGAAHSDPQKQNNYRPVGAGLVYAQNEGITLIALIITVIVMLILVGVTINVALNGGLFTKAKKGSYQTEVSIIKEQLEVEKAIVVADKKGEIPANYGIDISKLDISDDLKIKYGTKLIISSNGVLYYNPDVVTNAEEQGWLEEIGINKYIANIWEERGMDISKAILDKTYIFDGSIDSLENEKCSDITIRLNADGTMYWGRKYGEEFNDYTTIDLETIKETIEGGQAMCSGEKMSVVDSFFGYITVIFNGDSATLYTSATLGGTEGASLNTK